MSDLILNNLTDDSKIKEYITTELMPKVFHDIPLNVLNTGFFSIVNEYLSQSLEQQSFTNSLYFNESFITKAMLPDSIYANAALFNIGYSFASASSCNFLLELKIEDIYNNATLNADSGLYEFILDKNTKFNLSNGNVYSLDYDILIQYKNIETSSRSAAIPAWNIQYTNVDNSNSIAKNNNTYIMYRVTDMWLCLFVQASEYDRTTYIVTNNTMNNIPNPDKVIDCLNHICGFDVTYIDGDGKRRVIPHDHILPIHSSVKDNDPYIHYIMDNPQTIRFIFQWNGSRYFVPAANSSYEIVVYTCHGEAANFTAFDNMDQPQVITSANVYSNNANVMKAGFVISGSLGGTNIGTVETVRRETIQAYNTANVISSDHDIEEWFKTFFFKNILYPFFFKRRDDPWGKIWSGFLALKDDDDYIFRTNTLHGKIRYDLLYNNNDNTVNQNEIIIPPGWIWVYNNENRFTVMPYTNGNSKTIETAKTLADIDAKFVFSNPFGMRIQKDPFSIGYFNPWINESVTATRIANMQNTNKTVDNNKEDVSYIYHATPVITNISRTYRDNYYKITTYISPTISSWIDGHELVQYVQQNAVAPLFTATTWNYFKQPLDLFCPDIPMIPLYDGGGYIPFNPDKTYFCVKSRNRISNDKWQLTDMWIDDASEIESKRVFIPITGDITMLYGTDDIWGEDGLWKGHEIFISGDTNISISPVPMDIEHLSFTRVSSQNYYELRMDSTALVGNIVKMVVGDATTTSLTKYGVHKLTKIGRSYSPQTYINIYFANGTTRQYMISNAANIYTPYDFIVNEFGQYVFELDNVGANSIILYADMKPTPDSGAVDYYRIPLSSIPENRAMFYIANKLLPLNANNMRVILHAMMNGSDSGYVEMQPVKRESDGSYRFEATMYPMNDLVDIDNRINIASVEKGGGSWVNANSGSTVSLDATKPELKISIFIRTEDELRDSDLAIDDSLTGFRIADQYVLDDVSLVQELKEMRSVVNFGESSIPSDEQLTLYKNFSNLNKYDPAIVGNVWSLCKIAYDHVNNIKNDKTLIDIHNILNYVIPLYTAYVGKYIEIVKDNPTSGMMIIGNLFDDLILKTSMDNINWDDTWSKLNDYQDIINTAFESVNVNGGVEIQLMPVVEYSLMNSERFASFVSAFTQVHKAIEPVILNRLEGNNYLDCKLIATYGLPHSYTSDIDKKFDICWPDLNVQMEFDVKLFNLSLTTNTLNELRMIVKSYFNRLTSIHTPVDLISMNNNIYISHIIQQMETHSNVVYMKFVGWYTNEKNIADGDYRDANTQAIVQCYDSIDKFPNNKLESYVPEMFTLDDENIVINVIK